MISLDNPQVFFGLLTWFTNISVLRKLCSDFPSGPNNEFNKFIVPIFQILCLIVDSLRPFPFCNLRIFAFK